MKIYIKRIFLVAILLVMGVSCDSDFAELNTDPNRAGADVFDPNLILPNVLHKYHVSSTGYEGGILYQSMWVQILADAGIEVNYFSGADKYVAPGSNNSYLGRLWQGCYEAASRSRQMELLAIDNELSNLAAIAKILQIMNVAQISDVYGDVPYTDALQAQEGVVFPSYDLQSELYPQLLADLEVAVASLSDSGDTPTNDTMYGGDIGQWRKFGYSLMLKLAMRLSERDATTAQSFVSTAISGGIFTSSADDAIVIMDDSNNYGNKNTQSFGNASDAYQVKWSKTLIDYLSAVNDPRLPVVSEIPPAGVTAAKVIGAPGNNDPAVQQGMPNGFDSSTSARGIINEPNYPGPSGSGDDADVIGGYSRPTAMYRNFNAPWFIVTYSEVQLLLADAAIKGFTVPNSATAYYTEGVTAAMETLNKLGGTPIEAGDVANFLTANPLDVSSTEASLQQINEQIWATLGLTGDYVGAWSNWRRSNYPVLTPVDYPGNFSGGNIPLRQPYNTDEATRNTENYNDAISRLSGSEDWVTPVWWDN